MYKIKIGKNKYLKGYTEEEVFGESMKSPDFRKACKEEEARLRMISQLRKAREEKKMTQKELAKEAGMPQSAIARIESGRRGLSWNTLSSIATALGKEIRLM